MKNERGVLEPKSRLSLEKKEIMAYQLCDCRPSQCRKITLLLLGERISIVEDVEGVTRDRIYATAEWLKSKI